MQQKERKNVRVHGERERESARKRLKVTSSLSVLRKTSSRLSGHFFDFNAIFSQKLNG